ncbi:MAG: hypothetical protein EP329_16525 [Deltaproteobacteria bacterium]|nr:MAG: hypothetical protein EP329_16525 [Deltaproteobacteria bacterium]
MLRAAARPLTALALLLFVSSSAAAQAPPSEVKLPLAQYEALVKAARDRGGPQPTWGTGRIEATLPSGEARFVEVQLDADVSLVGEGIGEVLLLPGNVILESARIDGSDATLVTRGGVQLALLDARSGRRYSVSLSYRVPVAESSDGAAVAMIPLPQLPGSTLTVDASGLGAVEVWPNGSVQTTGGGVIANLPATHAAVLRWGSASTALRRVDYAMSVDPGSDGAEIVARFEVLVEGARAAIKVAPDTVAMTEAVEGGKPVATRVVAGWHEVVVTGAGRHLVTVTFRTGIDRSQGQPEVGLTVARAPIMRVDARIPGHRAVTFDPEVPVTTKLEGADEQATTLASAYLPPTEAVKITWTEPRTAPEKVVSANAETYQLVRIEEGVIRSKVEIRYEIIRGTLKELPVQLPDDANVVLYRVAGDGIEDWRTFQATDSEPRQARIFLGNEREGSYVLTLELEKVVPTSFGAEIDVPLVRPLNVTRERGVVALFDGEKVSFAPATTGNAKTGEDALPVEIRQKLGGDIVTQAFKHIGAPQAIASKVQEAKERAFSFDARTESLYLFQQNTLEVRAIVAIDVKSGRTDEIVLSLPRGVDITGEVNAPSLKAAEWAPGDDEASPRRRYRVQLTQALGGHFTIELTLSLTVASDVSELAVPDIRVEAAKVQKGVLGVATEAMMEVDQRAMSGLTKLDVSQLPRSITLQTKRDVELGYGWSFTLDEDAPSLTLGLKRHKTVETLTAAIRRMWVETTVFEEGEIVSRATFDVENKDQNFLRLDIPAGAKVLGAAVDGENVEPIADNETTLKVRIPKQRRALVDLTFKVKRDSLGFLPSIDLVAPRPAVFVNDFQWLVHVPEKFGIYRSSSALREVEATEWTPPEHSSEAGTIDVSIRSSEATTERMYRADVYDAAEAAAAPSVSLSLISTPGGWLDTVLFVLALFLFAWAAWRRTRRAGGRKLLVFLAIFGGVLLLFAKTLGWGISGGEAVVMLVALALVVLLAWIQRHGAEAP